VKIGRTGAALFLMALLSALWLSGQHKSASTRSFNLGTGLIVNSSHELCNDPTDPPIGTLSAHNECADIVANAAPAGQRVRIETDDGS
jgi:hypothetical protein